MTIRFLKATAIHNKCDGISDATLVGQIFANAIVEVEDQAFAGTDMEGNTRWYRDHNGWYYWSGNAVVLVPGPAQPIPVSEVVLNGNNVATEEHPDDADAAVAALFEPDPDDDIIPEGETRLAEKERTGAIWIEGGVFAEEPAPRYVAAPPPEAKDAEIYPAPEKLNWGIQQLDIPNKFWVQRRATGKNVRLALLTTGVAPDCPDISIADAFILHGLPETIADTDGLGTQAAIVATGRGEKLYGVAPGANLLVARLAAFQHAITPQAMIQGIDWALDSGAEVIALLAHFPHLSAEEGDMLRRRIQDGLASNIIFLAPAGHPYYPDVLPARIEGVLSVGACNMLGQRSAFTADKGKIDLLAPGEDLDVISFDGEQIIKNTPNTIIATAFTAGCVALLAEHLKNTGQAVNPAAVIQSLRQNPSPDNPFNRQSPDSGFGLLHLS